MSFTKNCLLLIGLLLARHIAASAQENIEIINDQNIYRAMHILASDSLKGRGNGTDDLLKAGLYIGQQFKEAGLLPLTGQPSFYLPFPYTHRIDNKAPDILAWNGKVVKPKKFIYVKTSPGRYSEKTIKDFTVIELDTCFTTDILAQYDKQGKDILLWTNHKQPGGEEYFPKLIKMIPGGLHYNLLLVYATEPPTTISLQGIPSYYSNVGYNVVGMLPGKTKPNEIVIFSAHYDHVGINENVQGDNIYNGANDDASGTTAVLMLANFFAKQNDNARTILFCAFAGEELGLYGSSYFVPYLDPKSIIANINIEMIGVPQYGKNAAMITGYRESTLPKLLNEEMEKLDIILKADRKPERNLYRRSDNYSFVTWGVPAHSIMGSDDDDPCYHKPCDDLKHIDIKYMTKIIRAIAISSQIIIDGTATPK